MKQNITKVFALLLTLCMLIGILPVSILAAEVDAAEFVSQQLLLGDDLTMRFQVNVNETYVEDAVMTITVAGVEDGSYSVKEMTPEENGSYLFAVNLAAAQMTDSITLTLTANETVLAEKSYSVQAYAHTLLNGNYTEATKNMVKHMLNYGAKAQTYFDYQLDNLANVGYGIDSEAKIPTESGSVNVIGSVDGIRFYGATLVFESKIAVRYYFTNENDATSYTFKVGEMTYNPESKNGLCYVEVPDINPQSYETEIEMTVQANGQTLSVKYSPMHYITRMYNKETTSDSLKALLQALYGYHKAAVSFEGIQTEEIPWEGIPTPDYDFDL